MKKYQTLVLVIVCILLFLFQIAVWVATPHPKDDASILEVFWYILQITVPIMLSIGCAILYMELKEKEI